MSFEQVVPRRPQFAEVGPLSRTDFVRYQGASGDMQPIHHDEEIARSKGLPGPFSVGMYQAGLLGTWLADWFGPENIRSFRVRFKTKVWPGDILTLSGEVVDSKPSGGGLAVEVQLRCVTQHGEVAIEGTATCLVPEASTAIAALTRPESQ